MPRIIGVDSPKEKRIDIALTYIDGIGRTLAAKVLKAANIDLAKRAKDLTEEEVSRLATIIQKNSRIV